VRGRARQLRYEFDPLCRHATFAKACQEQRASTGVSNRFPFSNRRAWGSRESNVAQASKVTADTLAGCENVRRPTHEAGG
jgi:hypothetical protein